MIVTVVVVLTSHVSDVIVEGRVLALSMPWLLLIFAIMMFPAIVIMLIFSGSLSSLQICGYQEADGSAKIFDFFAWRLKIRVTNSVCLGLNTS